MALGLHVVGKILWQHWEPRSDLEVLQDIARYLLAQRREALQILTEVQLDRDKPALAVWLYPAAGWVHFWFEPGRALHCSALTHPAGPGYHAHLVRVLDECGFVTYIRWRWKDRSGEPVDSTGYAQNRKFPQLQAEMLKWLKGAAEPLAQAAEDAIYGLCMPPGYPPVLDGGHPVMTPMGYRDREWFREVAAAPSEQMPRYGEEFFPWWHKEQDARFWLNAALNLMWVECPWHQPQTKQEARLHQVVAGCLEQAYRLDPSLDYPWAEWKEVLGYFEDPVRLRQLEAKAPRDCDTPTIGMRRRLMQRPLAGDWSMALPGYYYGRVEQEPEAIVYWFDDRKVRAHVLKSQGEDGRPVPALDMLPDPSQAGGDIIELEGLGMLGWAHIERDEGEGQSGWMLRGYTAVDGDLLMVTISFAQLEDANWAVGAWRSIRHDCMQETAGNPAP